MNLRKPQAPPSLYVVYTISFITNFTSFLMHFSYEEVPDRGTQVMPIESSNNEEDPYLMTRDQVSEKFNKL